MNKPTPYDLKLFFLIAYYILASFTIVTSIFIVYGLPGATLTDYFSDQTLIYLAILLTTLEMARLQGIAHARKIKKNQAIYHNFRENKNPLTWATTLRIALFVGQIILYQAWQFFTPTQYLIALVIPFAFSFSFNNAMNQKLDRNITYFNDKSGSIYDKAFKVFRPMIRGAMKWIFEAISWIAALAITYFL